MKPLRINALVLLACGLIFGAASGARAQVTYTESGTGGCFVNPGSGLTDCAKATFSLMTGGTSGSPGTVISGTSATSVTGLQIVVQNNTPAANVTNYQPPDVLTGFFWGLNGSPALATSGTGNSTTFNGSVFAKNSLGGNAVFDPSKCSSVAVCTGTSINVGKYWAGHNVNGGWTGIAGTFPGAYAVATSGYSNLSTPAFGQGHSIGAGDPTLASGGSQLNLGLIGGAGSTPTVGGNFPAVQDTVVIQVAFASALTSLNLNTDIIAADVFFTYGTNPDASTVAKKAPEPASIALFGVGA